MNPPLESKGTFGHYDIEAVLGQGAMGTVYLARDRRIGRRVALKTIQVTPRQVEDSAADTDFFARLQREAEVCGALNHPNLVTLYEAGYEEGRISYLAIEYVKGESLQALLRKSPALPLDTALQVTEEVLKGLAYAHEQGVIHRDIKPANILLSAEGGVKIADFGIARPAASDLTRAGMLMGTPTYMAPEQVRGGKLSPRTDLFSLGVMLFQMLTGRKPFTGPDVSGILYSIVHQPAPSIAASHPQVPARVVALVEKLMAKDPEQRYGSANEALRELRDIRQTLSPVMIAMTGADRPVHEAAEDLPHPQAGTQFDRTVPTRIFWSVAALVLVGTLVWASTIAKRIRPLPTVEISQRKLREFEEKRRLLLAAEALFHGGSYEESARTYEEYLKRWPESPAAQQGLERARDAQREFEVVEKSPGADTGTPAKRPKKKEQDWLLQQLKGLARKASGD